MAKREDQNPDCLPDFTEGRYRGAILAKFCVKWWMAFQQLKNIKAPKEMIISAATSALTFEENAGWWMREGLVEGKDLEQFQDDLICRYEEICAYESAKRGPDEDDAIVGMRILMECYRVGRQMHIPNVSKQIPNGAVEGCLHVPAEYAHIGWHPLWNSPDIIKRYNGRDVVKREIDLDDKFKEIVRNHIKKDGVRWNLPLKHCCEEVFFVTRFGKQVLETFEYWRKRNAGEVDDDGRPYDEWYELGVESELYTYFEGHLKMRLRGLRDDFAKALADEIGEYKAVSAKVVDEIEQFKKRRDAKEERVEFILPPECCPKRHSNRILLCSYAMKELLDIDAKDAGGRLIDQGKFKFKKGLDKNIHPRPGSRRATETWEVICKFFEFSDSNGVTDFTGSKDPLSILRRKQYRKNKDEYLLSQHVQAVDEMGRPLKKRGRRSKKLYQMTWDIVR